LGAEFEGAVSPDCAWAEAMGRRASSGAANTRRVLECETMPPSSLSEGGGSRTPRKASGSTLHSLPALLAETSSDAQPCGVPKKMGAGPRTRPTGGCDREQEGDVSIAATCVALEAQRPGGRCRQTVSLPPHSDEGSGGASGSVTGCASPHARTVPPGRGGPGLHREKKAALSRLGPETGLRASGLGETLSSDPAFHRAGVCAGAVSASSCAPHPAGRRLRHGHALRGRAMPRRYPVRHRGPATSTGRAGRRP